MVLMTEHTAFAPALALAQAWATMVEELNPTDKDSTSVRLKVFLDGDPWLADAFRSHVEFVEYVESPPTADVRIHVKRKGGRGESHSYTVTFIGMFSIGVFMRVASAALLER